MASPLRNTFMVGKPLILYSCAMAALASSVASSLANLTDASPFASSRAASAYLGVSSLQCPHLRRPVSRSAPVHRPALVDP